MADLRWSLICRRAIVDKASNLLTLIDLLEELTIDGEEVLPDPEPGDTGVATDAQLVCLWTRSDPSEAEHFWQTVALVGPNGETNTPDVKVEVELADHKRIRVMAGIKAVRFYGLGTYRFDIYFSKNEESRGKKVGSVPLDIKRAGS